MFIPWKWLEALKTTKAKRCYNLKEPYPREGGMRLISLKELSIKTGIPYSTIARYTKEYSLYISRRKEGRKLLFFEAEALEVTKRVHQLYEDGKNTKQIHEILSSERTQTIDINPIQDEMIISHLKKALSAQAKRMEAMEQELENLKRQTSQDKSEILQGVNEAMLEFMRILKDKQS